MSPSAAAAQAARAPRVGTRARTVHGARHPRRVSGPARRVAPARSRSGSRTSRLGALVLALASALERLASHRLLDRLIRGRAWLVLVTFALIGIVTLQLALLKLNGTVGRALHSEALLQRENATLSIENSQLAAADHVQAGAAQLGMAFASSAALRFLAPSSHADFARGAAALSSSLHAPGTGSEGGTSGHGSGSSGGEGGGSEQSGGEARASAGQRAEAPPSEGAGPSPAGGGPESSSTRSAGTSSEAPSASPGPAQSPEASSASEASPAGGTQAVPAG